VRVGIFGGTFDPPHLGHLIAAQDAAISLELDRVDFVPARDPPHKQNRTITPAAVRLSMLSAALEGASGFRIDESELCRPGPSFTVDTLRSCHAAEPGVEWFLMIGMDQYAEFRTWREPVEIERLATIVVLARDGESPGVGPRTVPITRIDVSSTMIRDRVRTGLPIRYIVAPGVEHIIRASGLYTSGEAVPAGRSEDPSNRPESVG
jgi:nicotinate-nucleotide adenylyltransferase